MPPKAKGRMIRENISRSKRVGELSKEAALLFVMLIPHFSAHGKMNGSPNFIKGEVVPRMTYFDLKLIEKCLKEISLKTRVKWFEVDGLFYLQSLNWQKHQDLRESRLGVDELPSFVCPLLENSGTFPGERPPEVKRSKGEGEGKSGNNISKNLAQKPDYVTDQTWADFQTLRKAKKAPLTVKALDGIIREVKKAGWMLEDALIECCARGWQGFKAEWVKEDPAKTEYHGPHKILT